MSLLRETVRTSKDLLLSALALMAALAWNTAIKGIFEYLNLDVVGPLVYALFITFVTVGLGTLINNYFPPDGNK